MTELMQNYDIVFYQSAHTKDAKSVSEDFTMSSSPDSGPPSQERLAQEDYKQNTGQYDLRKLYTLKNLGLLNDEHKID